MPCTHTGRQQIMPCHARYGGMAANASGKVRVGFRPYSPRTSTPQGKLASGEGSAELRGAGRAPPARNGAGPKASCRQGSCRSIGLVGWAVACYGPVEEAGGPPRLLMMSKMAFYY